MLFGESPPSDLDSFQLMKGNRPRRYTALPWNGDRYRLPRSRSCPGKPRYARMRVKQN